MGKIDLPYVQSYRDVRGKMRYYYRRSGMRQRLIGEPGSVEFSQNYQRIHLAFQAEITPAPAQGTLAWLVEKYYKSHNYTALGETTQVEYRRYLDAFREKLGEVKLTGITRKVLISYHARMNDTPAAANSCLRVIKTLFYYATYTEDIKENPAEEVKPFKIISDGWEPWPAASLETFAEKSTGASRTAYYLALYTGQRRGDILKMRWADIKDGGIALKQSKTGVELWIPLHAKLVAELDAVRAMQKSWKVQPLTIVSKQNATAYTDDGFGTIWQREQVRLNIRLPFHGLRKNATVALFEAGCTPQEVQAITGHRTLQMVAHYGRGAEQKRMAKSAMEKRKKNESV